MYFWNTNALTQELKQNKVDEHSMFKYFLASAVITQLSMMLLTYFPKMDPEQTAGSVTDAATVGTTINFLPLVQLLILVIGIIVCYQNNRKGDNQHFISRMICLNLPLIVRIFVLTFILAVILEIFRMAQYSSLIEVVALIFYYIWMHKHIGIASQTFDPD